MKLFKCLLLSTALAGGFIGCSEYDDAWIKEAIEDLKDRVTTLEDWCKTANSNISALQTLVTALEKNDYITGIVPVTENGKEIGYTISFKNSPSIIVYHGKDGQDGVDGEDGISPVVGVAKGNDGLYYWTQKIGNTDPAFILDEKGNKLPASGTNTSPAVAPRLSIDAQGYWMIDVDGKGAVRMKDANGKDVKATGTQGPQGPSGSTGSQGPAGDSIFKSIDDSNPDYVIITLKDGTKLALAKFPVIWVTAGNAEQEIADAIGKAEMNKSEVLYLGGTLSAGDFTKLNALTSLKTLDLSYITDKELPEAAFQKNTTIEKIVLPKTLTKIKRVAFSGCTALTTVEIPATVIEIGEWAFEDCTNLTSITLPSGLKKLDKAILSGCTQLTSVNVPQGVTEVGERVFQKCSNLLSVTLPQGVKTIGKCAFYNCTSLATLSVPNTVTEIGEWAFESCTALSSITIPESVIKIGEGAFFKSSSLEAIVIPSKVTVINIATFTNCSALKDVTLNMNVTEIGERAFYQCTALESITLPEKLTTLAGEVFGECTALKSITLPEGVTAVPFNAFIGCSALESVQLSSKTVSLSNYAFGHCSKLLTITLPETVTTIAGNALANSGFTSIICKATTPPVIDPLDVNDAFKGLTSCKLNVPEASVSAYTGSTWNTYFSGRIEIIAE